MKPGPNDVLPCGTESARRRHLAHGEICTNGCETFRPDRLQKYVERLERENTELHLQLAAVQDRTAAAKQALEAAGPGDVGEAA